MAENKEAEFSIAEKLSKTEKYIEDNRKSLGIILGAVVVIVGGYLAYLKFIVEPADKKAQGQMFMAEKYFEADSLKKAIEGDGNFPGFKQIIEDYGSTRSGNLAHYYLGICYLKTGKYADAIEHLNAYDAEDLMTGIISVGAVGDAYMEQGKTEEAINYYRQAAEKDENNFTAPVYLMKAAMAYESSGKYADALTVYQRIKKDFPASNEAYDVDKYIARAEAMKK
jgi:tetratricopeptide (TPR) repeat protein